MFILSALMAFGVAGIILAALFRGTGSPGGSAATIYDDQLSEVARDEARGLLAPGQASQARAEVERRLLDAARREADSAPEASRLARFVLALGVGAMPALAAAVYLATGNPGQPDTRFADRAPGAPNIAELRDQLTTDPTDIAAWAALGDALVAADRRAEAVPAYAEAVRLTGGRDRRLAGRYAETLALTAGSVTPEAEEIFATIKAQHPDDPQATYYIAQAKVARGEAASAIADLQALLAKADPAAPWYAGLAALLTELKGTSGAPPAPDVAASGPTRDVAPGPTFAQIEAASALSDEQRTQMIRAMVDGLDARLRDEPNDPEGWRRLARAYAVLGDEQRARAAWLEVRARLPGDEEALAALGE